MKNIIPILLIASLFLTACTGDENSADAFGNFEATEIFVSAKSSGELTQFTVSKGDQIRKDQLLGIIDTTMMALQKEQLIARASSIKARLKEVDAQVMVLKAKLGNLNKNQDRLVKLVAGEAATQQSLDNINTEVLVAERQINQAYAGKNSISKELEVIVKQNDVLNKQIADCHIYSPIDGTVMETFFQNKELCMMGKPLMKLSNLDNIELKAYIDATLLSELTIGKSVKVAIDGSGQNLIYFDGKVIWVASEAEFTPKIIQTPEERTNLVYAIKVAVKNDGKIKIGMPGEMYLNTPVRND
jgi:HlyD family secretion protein